MAKEFFTDAQVEAEIERLKASDAVKLAKYEETLKNRRRQYMYGLRTLERKGKEMIAAGITKEILDAIYNIEE